MPYGMYLSAEGAQVQAQRLEVIANNLANVNTVGFKPDTAAFQARFAEAIQEGRSGAGSGSINDLGGGVKVIETQTSFAPGRLRPTGGDNDLAIIGNGFFQVEGPNDEPLLTRAGDFQVDAAGVLRTSNGHAVLDAGGSRIQLAPDLPYSFSQDGFIEQGGGAVALALVEPASLDELNKVGGNLFRPRGEVFEVESQAREVRSGYLEMSAANQIDQMMAMIEVNRAFEANTRMIQTQDSASGNLIGRVLRTA